MSTQIVTASRLSGIAVAEELFDTAVCFDVTSYQVLPSRDAFVVCQCLVPSFD